MNDKRRTRNPLGKAIGLTLALTLAAGGTPHLSAAHAQTQTDRAILAGNTQGLAWTIYGPSERQNLSNIEQALILSLPPQSVATGAKYTRDAQTVALAFRAPGSLQDVVQFHASQFQRQGFEVVQRDIGDRQATAVFQRDGEEVMVMVTREQDLPGNLTYYRAQIDLSDIERDRVAERNRSRLEERARTAEIDAQQTLQRAEQAEQALAEAREQLQAAEQAAAAARQEAQQASMQAQEQLQAAQQRAQQAEQALEQAQQAAQQRVQEAEQAATTARQQAEQAAESARAEAQQRAQQAEQALAQAREQAQQQLQQAQQAAEQAEQQAAQAQQRAQQAEQQAQQATEQARQAAQQRIQEAEQAAQQAREQAAQARQEAQRQIEQVRADAQQRVQEAEQLAQAAQQRAQEARQAAEQARQEAQQASEQARAEAAQRAREAEQAAQQAQARAERLQQQAQQARAQGEQEIADLQRRLQDATALIVSPVPNAVLGGETRSTVAFVGPAAPAQLSQNVREFRIAVPTSVTELREPYLDSDGVRVLFEAPLTLEAGIAYYDQLMQRQGFERVEAVATEDDKVVALYRRGAQAVRVTIETEGGGDVTSRNFDVLFDLAVD